MPTMMGDLTDSPRSVDSGPGDQARTARSCHGTATSRSEARRACPPHRVPSPGYDHFPHPDHDPSRTSNRDSAEAEQNRPGNGHRTLSVITATGRPGCSRALASKTLSPGFDCSRGRRGLQRGHPPGAGALPAVGHPD